ncbi:MAG TPA: TetR family transcriptional regulator [Burkholderiales bacterium]|nr:TetR family transcriptional regulator [Burkholderiales bacterium]
MARRTKDEALETRGRILDAAERVFSEHGVSRTSLEDVARAAGVTRGAIYWHFKDKGDLFAAMVSRITLPMEAMVARSSDESVDDPIGSLKKCAVSALMRTATDPQVRRVFDVVTHKCEYLGEMAGVNNRVSAVQKGCVDRAEQAIRNAIKRGQLPASVNPRLAAVGLDAMLYGLISNWIANPGYLRLERQAEAMIDLFLGGLKAGGARRAKRARNSRERRAAGRSPARRGHAAGP